MKVRGARELASSAMCSAITVRRVPGAIDEVHSFGGDYGYVIDITVR